MTDPREQTISGIGWNVASQFGKQGIAFIVAIILARLLSPKEFGILGMVLIFTGFIDTFIDMGLGSALIQKTDLEPKHVNAVFWINVSLGLLLTLVTSLIAPLIAIFFHMPILKPIAMVISLNFFFGSFRVVQEALLLRKMEFRRLALIDNISILVAGCCAVIMALAGLGVWSLVGQSLFLTLTSVVMLWSRSRWRPSFTLDWNALRQLLGYSANLFGFNMVNYWIRNLDNILIGKFIGSAPLGIYARAYSLMLLPISQIAAIVGKVMFPVLSSIQDDLEEVRKLYLQVAGVISLVTFPLMIGLFVVAKPFILTLFGDKWAEVIPVLQVLCVTGTIQSVGTTTGWIYISQGRTRLMFRWGLSAGALFAMAMIIGLRWGILGVAWSYTICNILLLYPAWAIPGRLINLSFLSMVRNVMGTFVCGLAMGAVVWSSGVIVPPSWPNGAILFVQVSLGIAVYCLLIHLFRLKPYRDAREIVWDRIKGARTL